MILDPILALIRAQLDSKSKLEQGDAIFEYLEISASISKPLNTTPNGSDLSNQGHAKPNHKV